jgi:hypothetical protein
MECSVPKNNIMRFIIPILTLILFPNLLFAQDSFVKKYSGAYTIVVQGYSGNDSEAYALKPDGTAVWIFGYKDSSGRLKTQKKFGNWAAKDGFISVTINGNTGKITQNYRLKNSRFVSTEDSKTYLKKN